MFSTIWYEIKGKVIFEFEVINIIQKGFEQKLWNRKRKTHGFNENLKIESSKQPLIYEFLISAFLNLGIVTLGLFGRTMFYSNII